MVLINFIMVFLKCIYFILYSCEFLINMVVYRYQKNIWRFIYENKTVIK